jgi:hypothetical protein
MGLPFGAGLRYGIERKFGIRPKEGNDRGYVYELRLTPVAS